MTARACACVALAALGFTVAACGGGSGGSAESATTVAARSVDGVGTVLVDRNGAALYTNDRGAGCSAGCAATWPPLTVASASSKPTAGDGVSGAIAVVKRPDGAFQVTYAGKPLYRFSGDGGAGHVSGDGAKDTFDGTHFNWSVVTIGKKKESGGSGYGY